MCASDDQTGPAALLTGESANTDNAVGSLRYDRVGSGSTGALTRFVGPIP